MDLGTKCLKRFISWNGNSTFQGSVLRLEAMQAFPKTFSFISIEFVGVRQLTGQAKRSGLKQNK